MKTNKNRLTASGRLLAIPAFAGAAFFMLSAPAMAQSNVNIYGGISLALTKASGTSAAINTTGFGNFIGFKGSEDLGGGLTAYFDMRSNFDADTGGLSGGPGAVLWGEKSFVGLKGGFGSVQMGRFLNAYDDISFKAFGDTVASERGLGYSGRDNNMIGYYSPNFGGFTFAVTTAMKEGVAGNNVSSFNVKYANGPITVGLAHESASKKTDTLHNSTLIGGSYDFGMIKLLADYAKASQVTVNTNATHGADINESNLRMGVSVPVGAGAFKTAFTKAKNSTKFDRQIGLGYWYNLSKRTFVFADVNSTRKPAAGSTTSVDFGINHNF